MHHMNTLAQAIASKLENIKMASVSPKVRRKLLSNAPRFWITFAQGMPVTRKSVLCWHHFCQHQRTPPLYNWPKLSKQSGRWLYRVWRRNASSGAWANISNHIVFRGQIYIKWRPKRNTIRTFKFSALFHHWWVLISNVPLFYFWI